MNRKENKIKTGMSLEWRREYIIEQVNDTREFDSSRRKPIPGTGDFHSCDHCGKLHEVHVQVRNFRTNEVFNIGTGCCKNVTMNWEKVSTKSLLIEACKKFDNSQTK